MNPEGREVKDTGHHDGEIRAAADQMVTMLERLSAVELAKRTLMVGSDDFIEHAREAERLARLVFRWSQLQLQLAEVSPAAVASGEMSGVAIDVIAPRPIDRILAEWREAQIRLEIARPGSPEATQAADDIERLRDEYHAAHRQVREREG
jgi:hypothetical protein